MTTEPTTQAGRDLFHDIFYGHVSLDADAPEDDVRRRILVIEAEARAATGLRAALTDTRTILSAHILRLARYHRLDRGHLGTFTHEAIALIDAALATAPPEPRWPSEAVHESANDGFGPDPLGAPPEPRWPSPDDDEAVTALAVALDFSQQYADWQDRARAILAALREGGER